MSKTAFKLGSAPQQWRVAIDDPALLRGAERLRYVQQFQGAISPKRAKILLKELARARASFDRVILKRR